MLKIWILDFKIYRILKLQIFHITYFENLGIALKLKINIRNINAAC